MDAVTFAAWLASPARVPVVLVDATASVAGADAVVRLSSREFATLPTDAPANAPYLPRISGGVSVTESLPLDLTGSGMAWGDIRINNLDGGCDAWLGWVWANRPVTVLLGDISWPRSKFWPVFVGLIEDIDSPGRGELALKLRDSLQRLNTPVTETKLGGTTDNKDRLLPLSFGHLFNVEPLLITPNVHEYRVHQGAVTQIVEVRDQGLPVSFTPNLAAGTFRLNQRPFGQVTADVVAQGQATANAPALIRLLATQYGKASERFAVSEVDSASFARIEALCPQPVGLYLAERDNVLAVCQRLAASVGCMLSVSRLGKLRLVRLGAPSASARVVGLPDIVLGSDQLGERPAVVAGVKLGYAHNGTTQSSGLAGGVPEAHKTLYAEEWQLATQSSASTATLYRLHTEPEQIDTLLVRRTDADTEAGRRLALEKTPRHVVKVRGVAHLLDLTVGDSVMVSLPRWGLHTGAAALVVGAKPDWLERRTDLELLVWAAPVADVTAAGPGAGYQHDSVRTLQAASPRVVAVTLPGNVTVSGGQVTGPLGSSVTIGTGQLSGTLNLGQLPSTVVNAYTFNSYSVNAAQITAGTISTTRLAADVVTTNTLTAKISEADAIWTKNLFVWSGTTSIPNALINNINGQPIEYLIRAVVREWPWSATIDGVPATIQFN
jgi:hypothetical protein